MQELSPEETLRAALQISHGRIRKQHELAVDFGVRSLRAGRIDDLLLQACSVVAKGMNTPFSKVLTPLPDGQDFLLAQGVGWEAADIGAATVGADEASPAGYAFATNRPVISNHLGQELRFRTPALLQKYGIERAINVPIRGATAPYGVLEADSSDGDDFIESDLVFMEGIANVISMAIERITLQNEELKSSLYSESILNASPDCVKIMSPEGEIEFFNESGLCQMRIDSLGQIRGRLWSELWPAESRAAIESALEQVSRGESARFEAYCPTTAGEPRWWDITAAPICGPQGRLEKIIAVSRDITERHDHEARLAALIEVQSHQISESDLHLEEIHHRVRNSLHLVNTLLLLQANLAVEESVKLQLQTAANRVSTIANVHERLYQSAESSMEEPAEYLRTLLSDLSAAFGDRPISLVADDFTLPQERLAPLGMIVSELVTNALKYGKGSITVGIEPRSDHLSLFVVDEGNGFPDHFPKASGTGLGMRLVKTYSGYGNNAITVDRSTNQSRIDVRFKL